MTNRTNVAVIGAGSWGTALAALLGEKGLPVRLWARRRETAAAVTASRENAAYLPGVRIPEGVMITADAEEAVAGANVVIFVTPSHTVRETATLVRPFLDGKAVVVSAVKGIEQDTLLRMSQVLEQVLGWPPEKIAVLSGPNHAEEVGIRIPTTTVVAAVKRAVAEYLQEVLMTPWFRVYTNPDTIGVELGGALKNIIALGAGMSDGLGFGDNSKAALMTRGLAEITRLGTAMGSKPLTFAGLSGLGDLVVTCTSVHSRNRRAGLLLAQGQTMAQITAGTNMVVEGIRTTEAAYRLARQYNVVMPITEQLYHILYHGKNPREAVMELMTRGKTHEVEEVALTYLDW